MVDEDLLGYYIDCHGSWPDSFIWVFLTLMAQHQELDAQELLDLWFGEDAMVLDILCTHNQPWWKKRRGR